MLEMKDIIKDFENIEEEIEFFQRKEHYNFLEEENVFIQLAKKAAVDHSLTSVFPIGIVAVKDGEVVAEAGNGNGYHEKNLENFGHRKGCVRRFLNDERERQGKPKFQGGEGFEHCRGCHVDSHAEANLIKNAIEAGNLEKLVGAEVYMYGHFWCCKACWEKLLRAGVKKVYLPENAERFNKKVEIAKWASEVRLAKFSTDYIFDEIKKIKYTYGLNKVIRYTLSRQEVLESQSVAEHVYNMFVLAHYFRNIEDPENKLDFEKVTKMILMHDMGEIETGDIVMGVKNEAHAEKESTAINQVIKSSPKFIAKEIRSLYDEFENPQSLEAKFVKAIDKLEAQFWFSVACEDLKMIKAVTSVELRQKNENKRKQIWPELGFKIIEKFGAVMDEDARKRGLYK